MNEFYNLSRALAVLVPLMMIGSSAAQGSEGRLGQRVLGIQRRSNTDTDPTFNSESLRGTVSWDVNGSRLAAGNKETKLANSLEVFGVGFEMLGAAIGVNESWTGSFIGAVPEPNNAGLMIAVGSPPAVTTPPRSSHSG
jgi:hypothetical protein